jgi:hypothetical protein
VREWRKTHARAAGRRRRELPAPVDGRPRDDADVKQPSGIALDHLGQFDPPSAHGLVDLAEPRSGSHRPFRELLHLLGVLPDSLVGSVTKAKTSSGGPAISTVVLAMARL